MLDLAGGVYLAGGIFAAGMRQVVFGFEDLHGVVVLFDVGSYGQTELGGGIESGES